MTTSHWVLDPNELDQMVEEVVTGMMGRPPADARPTLTPTTWTAEVNVHGGWNGWIAIRSGPAFAHQAAGVMFGADADDTSDDAAMEALAELVNVLAGNIKSALGSRLGEACAISLPHTVAGSRAEVRGTVIHQVRRSCDEAPFEVWVVESSQVAPGGPGAGAP